VRPNTYRLTFFPDHEDAAPTNDWKRLEMSEGADAGARAAALTRAKAVAHAARARPRSGTGSFRSDEEAEAAAKPAEAMLKRLGKGKVGRPGNQHTRAALNELNSSISPRCRSYVDHDADRTVEKPGSHSTDRTVEGHGADHTVPSTTSVFLGGSAAEQRSDGESAAGEPAAALQTATAEPTAELGTRTKPRRGRAPRSAAATVAQRTNKRAIAGWRITTEDQEQDDSDDRSNCARPSGRNSLPNLAARIQAAHDAVPAALNALHPDRGRRP
jgi:hypothetical protein